MCRQSRCCGFDKMSKVPALRASASRRLRAAVEDILELFERTVTEYEEEVCRLRLLDAVFRPEVRVHRADVQQLSVPPGQQDWSSGVDREDPPELPHTDEEQEGEQLGVLDETFTAVPLSEEDNDEDPHTSQLRHGQTEAGGQDCGGPEPARSFNPESHLQADTEQTSHSETRDSRSGSDLQRSCEEPQFSTDVEMKGKEEQRQRPAAPKRRNVSPSSSDDEDSDVEKNFALLTEGGGGAEEEEQHHAGEEELSDDDDEEEGSDGDNEEDEEGLDGAEEESDDDGGKEEEGEAGSDNEDASADEDDDEESEDAAGSSERQTREDIKTELSSMSFEDILKLQNKVGTKVYNEVAYGGQKSAESSRKRRPNKNRPVEISAKKAAPFLRQVVAVRKPTYRDPRFDDLSGEYKPEIFEKTYEFINHIKHREKEAVQKQLKKKKMSNQRKEKLQFLLKRMENQERARRSREQQRERELHFKRQQRERANQGARPFFLKKSEKKKLQLAEKYEQLKKSGKLENFLSKKRKRNAVKDRRKLPQQLQRKEAA